MLWKFLWAICGTLKSCSPHGYWKFSCFFFFTLLKYMVTTKFNRPINLQIQIAWMIALENIWSYIGGIEFETGWVDILARGYFQKLRRPHICRVCIIRCWKRLMTIVSRAVILTFNFMHSFDLSYLTFSMLTHFLRREPGSAFYFNVLKI